MMATALLGLKEVHLLAEKAHEGQTDKLGVPYIEHVRAVAAGLVPFGETLRMAGLLHDVIEDTAWTTTGLRRAGVPYRVVEIVDKVTNVPGMSYPEKIRTIVHDRDAVLVKISDNAHNSHPDRLGQLPQATRERLARKYYGARRVLWPNATHRQIEAIVSIVNPELLDEIQR